MEKSEMPRAETAETSTASTRAPLAHRVPCCIDSSPVHSRAALVSSSPHGGAVTRRRACQRSMAAAAPPGSFVTRKSVHANGHTETESSTIDTL